MTDTATKILNVGQELIQALGRTEINIKTSPHTLAPKRPGVIHHFPGQAGEKLPENKLC